jgi:hypothetical protein
MKFQTGKLVEKNPGITSKEGKLALDLQNPNSKIAKLAQKVRQGNLDKADLEAAKELGYKPKQSKKVGTGVDYNPLSGIANFLKGLVTPKKKVDAKALLKKQQDEKEFRKKAGDKEVLGQFRRDLEKEKKAGGGHGRETGLKIKQRKKEEYEYLAGLEREKSRQQKSDDKLAENIAKEALEAGKLRRGVFDKGKRQDLILTDKSKKLINQYGPEFKKKVMANVKDLEPLVRSEKVGKETHSPEKLKQMKEFYKKKALKEIEKDVQDESMKRIKKTWDAGDYDKRTHTDKFVEEFPGKKGGVRRQTVEEAEVERSKKDPKARQFLIEQGGIPWEEMTVKERLAERAKDRAAQEDKEAKDYEKKAGFFGKLGDRLKTGEWFGSSKDILKAKRKLARGPRKDVVIDGKVYDTEEEHKRKIDEQAQKIKDRKKLEGAMSHPDIKRVKKLKPPVAPEVKDNVKEVKGVKDSVDAKTKGMSSKDKWNIGLAIGKAALQERGKALQRKEDREAYNRNLMTQARMGAAAQLGATGRQLMASGPGFEMGGSVKPGKKEMMKQATGAGFNKGGKLSFKEILKKKRMRY